MSSVENIVLISDVHLDNWPRNNPEKDFRMRTQPLMLAKRITQVMKEQQTNKLFILGDIINQWTASPQIMGVLVDFYRSLIKDNPDIYIGYILGQHDMRYYDDYSEDNSYVHIVARMFPENIHYLHDEYMYLKDSETEIYFSSYNRQGPLYPGKHVNVFLSHISFGFVEVDNSRADLIVAGDIHDFYDDGNCHSVGLPYQLYSHQPKDGVIGVVHCQGSHSTFERIKSDTPEFEFLKLDPITRRKVDEKNEQKEDLKIDSSDIMKMIDEEVLAHDVSDIHREIPMNDLPQPVNFHFQLKKLIIDNVRSIDHLELDLENLAGVNYIKGATGAGKSSIFYSLITALVGADKEELFRKTNRVTGKPLRLQLWLDYEGIEYYIDRSVKDTKLTIGGTPVALGKRDNQKKILEVLPFANYWRYFYIQANQHYFDSINKTELMRVLFNLKIFDYLFMQSKALLKTNNAKLKALKEDLIAATASKSTVETSLKELQEEYESFADCTISLQELNNLVAEEKELYDRAVLIKGKSEKADIEVIHLKQMLDEMSGSTKINFDAIGKDLEACKTELSDQKAKNEQFDRQQSKLMSLQSKLSALKSVNIVKCPHCGGVLKGVDEEQIRQTEQAIKACESDLSGMSKVDTGNLSSRIFELESQLTRADTYRAKQQKLQDILVIVEKLKKASADNKEKSDAFYRNNESAGHDDFCTKMSDLRVRVSRKEQLLNDIMRNEDRRSMFQEKINEASASIESQEKHVEQIVKYNSLFDIQNLSSIPYSILSRLVKYLNTDTVKFESSLNGEDFNITASIRVGDQEIAYEEASDGQKNYLDMFILIRITKFLSGEDKLGLIIMDEPLVNLDASYIDEASQLIPEISASSIFISSHTQFDGYDRVITVTQNENGLSSVKL